MGWVGIVVCVTLACILTRQYMVLASDRMPGVGDPVVFRDSFYKWARIGGLQPFR